MSNHGQNLLGIVERVPVSEPEDAESESSECFVAILVARRRIGLTMLRPIEFDDQAVA